MSPRRSKAGDAGVKTSLCGYAWMQMSPAIKKSLVASIP